MAHLKRTMPVLAALGLLVCSFSARADEPKKARQDGKKHECGHDAKELFEKRFKAKSEGMSDEDKAKLKEKIEGWVKEHMKLWHDGEKDKKSCHCECQDEADDEAEAKAEAKARAEAKDDGKVEVRKEEKREVRHRGHTREELLEMLKKKGMSLEDAIAWVKKHMGEHKHGRCDCEDKAKERSMEKDGEKDGKKGDKEGKGDKGWKDGKGHDEKPPGKGK